MGIQIYRWPRRLLPDYYFRVCINACVHCAQAPMRGVYYPFSSVRASICLSRTLSQCPLNANKYVQYPPPKVFCCIAQYYTGVCVCVYRGTCAPHLALTKRDGRPCRSRSQQMYCNIICILLPGAISWSATPHRRPGPGSCSGPDPSPGLGPGR